MIDKAIINNFLETERKNTPKMFYWGKRDHEFNTTSELKYEQKKLSPERQILFKPSLFNRIIILPFILVGLVILFFYILILINTPLSNGIFVLGPLVFVLFILFIAIYFVFLNKKTNYRINIGREGIAIAGKNFGWGDIQETFILVSPKMKNYISYLVILTKDETFHKFDLSNLGSIDHQLSSIIEYYKSIFNTKKQASD